MSNQTNTVMEELKQRILKEGRAKAEGGMGFLVEKGFAGGEQFLRDHNIPYHALATITRINEDNSIELA